MAASEKPLWQPDLSPVEEEEPYEEDYYDDDYDDDYGDCDVCGMEYVVSDSTDHCPEEGRCYEHCTDRAAHDPRIAYHYNDILEAAMRDV